MADGVRLAELIAPVYYPVHREMKSGSANEIWLKGGRGSAKSSFLSIEIVLGLLLDADANAIIYRKVAATLRESVYAQMMWAIDQLGLAEWFRAKLSPMEIMYKPTGQRILFRGADDPGKSKSIKLQRGYFKYLWFEELSEFSSMEDVHTIQASVIRGGGRALTLYSYNPPISARNWVNREALKDVPGRMTLHTTYHDVPPEWLAESFITLAETMRTVNERAYNHVYGGEVTGTGGQVFENLEIREITDAEIKTFGATYCGLDFGWYPDPAHFVRCAYAPAQRRLWIYGEYRTVKTVNAALADVLHKQMGVTDEEIIADSAELKSIADLRAFGFLITGATKGPGSVAASMQWLQGLNGIVIDPVRCPAATQEFTEYEYERDREDNPVAAYPDKNNHAIDAVRYAVNRVWMQRGM